MTLKRIVLYVRLVYKVRRPRAYWSVSFILLMFFKEVNYMIIKTVRNVVFGIVLLVFMGPVFAQTGSVAATVQIVPMETSTPVGNLAITTLASGGAWANSAGGPTLYSKNVWYYLYLNPVGSIPANATITTVSWSWGLSRIPSGLTVGLCHQTAGCGNVTSYGTGTTSAFGGWPANQQMSFAFIVSGTGTMAPVYGQVDQVIVNYQY